MDTWAEHESIAGDPFELEPSDPRPVVARVPQLPPLYYLHNFRLALVTLQQRYGGLLSAAESGFIEQFNGLSESAQCLLTRLVMRKGSLFRRVTLQYAEIPDVESAIQALSALSWLDTDPKLSPEDLALVLNSEELRLTLSIQRGRRTRLQRADSQQSQLDLPLQDWPTKPRPLADWNPHLAGGIVWLCIEPLIKRLQLLFFGNHYQSWAEFVLMDLGVKRYERVAIDADSRAFQSWEEIDHFYRLNDCRIALDAGESADAVLERASVPAQISGWLRSGFIHLHLRIGEVLEQDGNRELALQSYRECGAVEGKVRAVRLQLRMGLREAAERDALAAQECSCSEAQQEVIGRALARINRSRRTSPKRLRIQDTTEVIELTLPKLKDRRRVELAVREHLGAPGSEVFYVENSLLTSLFGLLCWEALFAPVQGAFFHPFQAAPADLYTAEFRMRRGPHFCELLGLLDKEEHEGVIWRLYRAKVGLRTNFVRWGRLRPPLLRLALQCIPASHLKVCFERMLEDLKENATGLPDLIQFWPTQRRYRLIEVKGPGDRLQHNQRRWLQFFSQQGIPAAVCHVRWQGPQSASAAVGPAPQAASSHERAMAD